jgi:hypothetical protein
MTAASFNSRRRALSGQWLNGTELPRFIAACSQTADSATAMFWLSELAEVNSHLSTKILYTETKRLLSVEHKHLFSLLKHSYMLRSNNEYNPAVNMKFQNKVKDNANIFTLLDPMFQ